MNKLHAVHSLYQYAFWVVAVVWGPTAALKPNDNNDDDYDDDDDATMTTLSHANAVSDD